MSTALCACRCGVGSGLRPALAGHSLHGPGNDGVHSVGGDARAEGRLRTTGCAHLYMCVFLSMSCGLCGHCVQRGALALHGMQLLQAPDPSFEASHAVHRVPVTCPDGTTITCMRCVLRRSGCKLMRRAAEPLWGALFAWTLLGERWGATGWLGAALIVGSSLGAQLVGGGSKEKGV